jgi:ABC-type nitrate/sulfonate/bicarbonate transport system substrate-binding protein
MAVCCCTIASAQDTTVEPQTNLSTPSTPQASLKASEIQGLDHVVMQLSWYPNFQFAGYYAAKMKGFYEEEGLDVEIRHRNVDLLPPDAVLSGKADFGNATSDAILLRMKGEPIVALAVLMQHSPWCLLVREDSGINVPADLINKTVALDLSYQDIEILAMFKNEGILLDRMNIVKCHKNVKQMVNKVVDAKATYIGTHPFYLEGKGVPGRVIRPLNYG